MSRSPRVKQRTVLAAWLMLGLAAAMPSIGLAGPDPGAQPAAPDTGTGHFALTGQLLLGLAQSRGVALGDLDGDRDLDAFVVIFAQLDPSGTRQVGATDRVLLGDGAGGLVDSGQRLGGFHGEDVALGDLDGDGDLDAFVANSGSVDQVSGNFVPEPNLVWRNAGAGGMVDTGQRLGPGPARSVALGDLDGDGDLDAFVAYGADPGRVPPGQPDRVWLNLGNGAFIDSGARLGSSDSADVALADLDRDGDLDAFVACDGDPDRVWLNDGRAHFRSSGQAIGNGHTWSVGLADLDGDGDVDAYLGGAQDLGALATPQPSEPDRVWLNTGSAGFADSGQALGADFTTDVALGDIDDDGDIDAVTAGIGPANRAWLNQGQGRFLSSGQSLGSGSVWALGLADLDRDLDLDVYQSKPGQYDRVWLNQDLPPGPSPSPSATATATRSPTASPSPSATATFVPGVTPSVTPTPSRTPTPSPTASSSPTPTPTVTPSVTPTATPTRTPTPTASPTSSATPSPT
ncbi:MAG: VCBS repeat-containing protein, partial [Chloroflexi bacterium]|nr:VCBS repeat-containing protein [Chloroflexota bacterium]